MSESISAGLEALAKAAASGSEAARAFAELAATLGEIEADWVNGDRTHMGTPAQKDAARSLVANALQHGFSVWFDCDPARPVFHRWLSPTKKLLGDNPDAVYYGAVTDPGGRYRIRGNVANAAYTSFTVETGAQEGHLSKGVVSTLNDKEFDVAPDGSYEILVSAEPPEGAPRNWLRLEPGAGSITTRHYFEWERSAAADPTFHVPIWIEPVDAPGPAAPMDDAAIAAGIRRVVNFVRGATIDFPDLPPEVMPAWVSREVNRFSGGDPERPNTEIGYSAKDIDYRQTLYEIAPDEALVLRGRFPRCRFANVVLWNHRLQTPPYRYRRVSLNRRQMQCRPDGSFEVVVAHRDPGHPNWISPAGILSGMIFWRFLLPEEEVPPIETELVAVDALA